MTRYDQIPMTDKIVRSVRVPCLKALGVGNVKLEIPEGEE